MSAFTPDKKHRHRRIASDEAHAWARNLRLHNSLAKLVLSMATLYVDGDGACFVGVPALAEDTELSPNTVRSRLAFLEEIGAIGRFPQWIDEAGRRNSEGRGRRTSDIIRLLIDADPDEIEARALGRKVVDGRASDPPPHEGSTEADETFDPPRAEGATDTKNLPRDSADPSVTLQLRGRPESLEPEPEDNPPTPQGGTGSGSSDDQESEQDETEGWQDFKTTFEADGAPIMRVSIAKTLFAALPPDKRAAVIQAAKGLIAHRARQRKPGAKPSAQTFIRETDAWEAFARHAPEERPPPPEIRFVPADSDEFRALQITDLIANREMRQAADCEGHGLGMLTRRLLPRPDLLALAGETACHLSGWEELDVKTDGQAIGAWRRRFQEWQLGELEAERVLTDEVFSTAPSGMPLYRKRERLIVPKYWPPLADGSWPERKQSPPSKDTHLATEKDLQEFAKTG